MSLNMTELKQAAKKFEGDSENTLNPETSASVASTLLKLAKQYGNSASTEQNPEYYISTETINSYIEMLDVEIQQQNDLELSTAWEFLQKKMQEAPNELDKVTLWYEGKDINLIIDTRTTISLIYAALTDKKTFPADKPKDRYLKLLSLFNEIKRLPKKPPCHHGIRHDFVVSTLNGVYPNVWVIYEIKNFIADLITEYTLRQAEKIRIEKDQQTYLQVILANINGIIHDELAKALADRHELRVIIERNLVENGLNPFSGKYKDMIDVRLKSLDESAPIPEGGNRLARQMRQLLLAKTEKDGLESRNKMVIPIKGWINQHFSLDNAHHQDIILNYALVEHAHDLYQKYHRLWRILPSDKLNNTKITNTLHQMDEYYKKCLSNDIPQTALNEFNADVKEFISTLNIFAKNLGMDWLQNFFASWQTALTVKNLAHQKVLHAQLLDPVIQEKYSVDVDFLNGVFPPDQVTVTLDYYTINRIFLFAIVTDPANTKAWTPLFAKQLERTINFVRQGFHPDDNWFSADGLSKYSYPNDLLTQLQNTLDNYHASRSGTTETAKKPMGKFIPMLHHIIHKIDYHEVANLIRLLPENKRREYSNRLKEMAILSTFDLSAAVLSLDANDRGSFLQELELEINNLKIFVTTHAQFLNFFKSFSFLDKQIFLDSLGVDFVRGLFQDADALKCIVNQLGRNYSYAFLIYLGAELINGLLQNKDELLYLMDKLYEDDRYLFLQLLGTDLVKRLFQNWDALSALTKRLKDPHSNSDFSAIANFVWHFVRWMGADFIKQIINNDTLIFEAIMRQIPLRDQSEYLKFLVLNDDAFLKGIIKCTIDLYKFNKLSEDEKKFVLQSLGIDFIKSLITEPSDLYYLDFLPEYERLDEIKKLGREFILNLVKDTKSALPVIEKIIPYLHRLTFAEWLGAEFINMLPKPRDFHWDLKIENTITPLPPQPVVSSSSYNPGLFNNKLVGTNSIVSGQNANNTANILQSQSVRKEQTPQPLWQPTNPLPVQRAFLTVDWHRAYKNNRSISSHVSIIQLTKFTNNEYRLTVGCSNTLHRLQAVANALVAHQITRDTPGVVRFPGSLYDGELSQSFTMDLYESDGHNLIDKILGALESLERNNSLSLVREKFLDLLPVSNCNDFQFQF